MHPFNPNNSSPDSNPMEAIALTSLETIPIIGSVLSKMYSNYTADERHQRLTSFINDIDLSTKCNLNQLKDKLEHLEQEQRKFISSLMQRTLNAVQEEIFYEEKKQYFRNIFLNIIENPPKKVPNHDLEVYWIECLHRFQLTEVKILKEINKNLKQTRSHVYTLDQIASMFGSIDKIAIQAAISKLDSFGFFDITPGGIDKRYKLNALGIGFINYCMKTQTL
jgi:hypothetical protein